jgi:phosphocarrier protein FPr
MIRLLIALSMRSSKMARSLILECKVMTILSLERIRLGATAVNKQDAIRQAGDLLVKSGAVAPAYIDGMLAREETMSTYMGNGVAIPHGQFDNRGDIHQNGISVLQLPDGILWEDDEKAYLVIGIAAASDSHVGILSNLAEVIEDEDVTNELVHTTDANLILATLGKEQTEED